jgi:N-acetylglucosamine-6-phosphate deacetylase
MGHTDTDVATAKKSIESGAKLVTHLDNALHKIEEGKDSFGHYAMEDKNLYKEVIFDGIHVKKEILQKIIDNTPEDHLIMVTDGLHVAGLPDGEYKNFNGTPLHVKDTVAYNSEGILNGSAKTMVEMFN